MDMLASVNSKDDSTRTRTQTDVTYTVHKDDETSSFASPSAYANNNRARTEKHYPVWVAIVFVLNYTFGGGALALPSQYYHAGYILGTIMLAWCGILTYCVCKMVVNLMYRAEAVTSIAVRYGLSKEQFIDNPKLLIAHFMDNIDPSDFRSKCSKLNRNEYELNHLIGMFSTPLNCQMVVK